MENRRVLIRFDSDTSSIDQAEKRLKALEAHKARIKCELDINGKVLQTNVEDALKKIQDGETHELQLHLDLSSLTKDLKQAEALCKQTTDEIQTNFEKITASRTVETLRKNYIGKKSFKRNSEDASQELQTYFDGAYSHVKALEFDLDDPTKDVNIERIYDYAKALKEFTTVANDVQSVAVQKGLKLDFGIGDWEQFVGGFENLSRRLSEQSTNILQNIAKQSATALPPIIDKIKSSFTELPEVLNSGYTQKASAEIEHLQARLQSVGSIMDELRAKMANAHSGKEYDALAQDFARAEQEARVLADTVAELRGGLNEATDYGNSMAEQLGAAEDQLDIYRQKISEMKSELATRGNIDTGFAESFQSVLPLLESINNSLLSLKAVIADVGDGAELSPLLQSINTITTTVGQLGANFGKLKTSTKSIFKSVLGDTSSFTPESIEALKALSKIKFDTLSGLQVNEQSFKTLINGLKKLSAVDLSQIKNLKDVNLKNFSELRIGEKSFDTLTQGLKELSSINFSTLTDLTNVDLSKIGGVKVNQKSFTTLVRGLKELSYVNLSNLKSLTKVDLHGFSDLHINQKSFTNLVEGLKELAKIDLTELQHLQGINFEGLSNLKYASSGMDALSKESKHFLDTYNKQIDSSLKRYRGMGISEDDLAPLKAAKDILNSTFTASGMSGMTDLNGEMKTFVFLVSEADDKIAHMAEERARLNQEDAKATKATSRYDTLLSKEKKYLTDWIKKGQRGQEDQLSFERIQAERREIEKQLEKDPNFNKKGGDARRKAIYADARKQYLDMLNDIQNQAKAIIDQGPDFINPDKIQTAEQIYKDIEKQKEKFNGFIDEDAINNAHKFKKELTDINQELKPKMSSKGTYLGDLGNTKDIDAAITKTKELIETRAKAIGSKINYKDLKNDGRQLIYEEVTKDGSVKQMAANIDMLDNSVRTVTKSEKAYISQGQQFVNSIKGKFAELTRYRIASEAMEKVFQFARKGITAVVDVNTAMTELKKVTDETALSYANFQKAAGETAVEVGATTKDIITSTADYSRLGYALDESAELAKNTAIYKNVGDGIDINTATEDIVSITKAYDIAAAKSMHVIDVLNEVGNTFAISSSGIGEGLKRSSSALAAGNNTFEESVAMLTAMNEVLQDPAIAGTTLKMLSLRLRGAKTDIEAAGESTDGMADSTSKLREQVAALTNVDGKGGFDIMTNNGRSFKSTYEILQGIAKVWKQIDDIDQANNTCLYVQKCA